MTTTILIVEDSRTQAAALAHAVRSAGHGVEVVSNGQRALDLLEGEGGAGIDLVLSDVQMPEMGGYELCRRLKGRAETRNLPIVLMTSLDSPQDVLDGLASGADNFVSKPIDTEVLLGRIGRLLGRRHHDAQGAREGLRLFDQFLPLTLDRDHAVEYLSATFEDYVRTRASERKVTAEAKTLRRSEQFLQSVLDGVSTCVGIVDAAGQLVATNHEWQTFDGPNPLIGPKCGPGSDFLKQCHAAADEHLCARTLAEELPGLLDGSRSESNVECHPHCADRWRCFRVRATRLGSSGPPRVVMSFDDITELKRAETRLQHEAHHDPLTGLANRALFLERLEHARRRSRRYGDRVAVLFCDLDRFKVVNDSLGHAAGDELLVEVSRRIEECIREHDSAARFGGDEFAILLERHDEDRTVFAVAERLQAAVAGAVQVEGQEVFTTFSIGIAIAESGDASPAELLRDADIAMYRAKAAGRATFVAFDQQMHDDTLDQLGLQTDLRIGLDNHQLFVVYQPVLDVMSGETVGAEALARWRHPVRGVVPPGKFIPLAEDMGLIGRVGLQVLEDACCQLAQWRRANLLPATFRMHVNLSGRQLAGDSFLKAVRETVARLDIDPTDLVFELTESVALTEGEEVGDAARALRDLGTGLAMDDFGTGFSSLTALRRLPFTSLKLDRSFVGRMDAEDADQAIVRALIQLGRAIGLEVVAEGVEQGEQLEMLQAMGCDHAQGYYFARPMISADFEGWLARSNGDANSDQGAEDSPQRVGGLTPEPE